MNAGVDFLVYFSQFLGQKQLNPDLIRKHILDSEYFVICIDENFSVLPLLTLGPEGFAVRDCPVCYRMFSINPGLYPQGAAAAPAVQQPEIPLGIVRRPFAAKLPPHARESPLL